MPIGVARRERQRETGRGGEVAHPRGRGLVERAAEQSAEQAIQRAARLLVRKGEPAHRRGSHAALHVFEPRKSLAEKADSFRTAAGGHRVRTFVRGLFL